MSGGGDKSETAPDSEASEQIPDENCMVINDELTDDEFKSVVRLFEILLKIDRRIKKSNAPILNETTAKKK